MKNREAVVTKKMKKVKAAKDKFEFITRENLPIVRHGSFVTSAIAEALKTTIKEHTAVHISLGDDNSKRVSARNSISWWANRFGYHPHFRKLHGKDFMWIEPLTTKQWARIRNVDRKRKAYIAMKKKK